MIITDICELRRPNRPVKEKEIGQILQCLRLQLDAVGERGVGLAAPQIGEHVRAAVVRHGSDFLSLANPVIVDRGRMVLSKNEGCLSLPGIRKNIWRHEEIFVTDNVNPNGIVLTGFLAIAVQHEIDHLDGVLIIDRAVDAKVGRNDPCPCGAKKSDGRPIKFKHCHGKR